MSEAAVEEKETKSPTRRVSDPELLAMHEIQTTLAELPEKSQSRVVMWMHDRWLSDESKD